MRSVLRQNIARTIRLEFEDETVDLHIIRRYYVISGTEEMYFCDNIDKAMDEYKLRLLECLE